MRNRSIELSLLILLTAFSIFLSSCGSPEGNQAPKGNANNAIISTNAANSAEAPKTGASFCSDAVDKTIVQQIRMFVQEDERLREQRRHINFYSVDCVVSLNGYTETWDDFQKLHAKINATDGVKKISIAEFDGPKTAKEFKLLPPCDSSTKPCGQICIPRNAVCEILD